MLAEMASVGIGRVMTPDARSQPAPEERWALDNGAFAAWRRGDPEFPAEQFRTHLEWGARQATMPVWAVVPDRVAQGPTSLDYSTEWLTGGELPGWPWYLAVQDGMPTDMVRDVARATAVAGLFVGGSTEFKVSTAAMWVEVADSLGIACHWGRASRMSWATYASEIGCTSCDTTQPLWERSAFRRWIANVRDGHWSPLQCRLSF